jgi:hypothetical protein
MPRKTTPPPEAPRKSARPDPTSYRLGDETGRQIDEIAAALADPLGRPLPATEVIREAVRRLHHSVVKSSRSGSNS